MLSKADSLNSTSHDQRSDFVMVHGYHLILPMYGFWLPNDPRGSWSDFVWKWELVRFGKATGQLERRATCQLTAAEHYQRQAARASLKYEPVVLNGQQALSISHGFAKQIHTSNYTVWACAILPEHTHIVVARHTYRVEQMARLLKGAATRSLATEDRTHFNSMLLKAIVLALGQNHIGRCI